MRAKRVRYWHEADGAPWLQLLTHRGWDCAFRGCLFGVRVSRFHTFGGDLILETDNHPLAVRNPSVHLCD